MEERWRIDFYSEADGTEPVKEFLADPSLKPGELKQFSTRLKLLSEMGLCLVRQRSDILAKIKGESKLYELRLDNTPNNLRFFLCTVTGRRFILLHAFKKKSKKTPPKEILIAIQRRDLLISMEDKEKKQ